MNQSEDMKKKAENPGRPEGQAGIDMLKRMNRSHEPLRNWGLPHIHWVPEMHILDAGCGGGGTIRDLLTLSENSMVDGIDYAEESITLAGRVNAEALGSRLRLTRADVAELPFDDDMFDAATCVETVYFWPRAVAGLEEIRRVLRPGGEILILNEASDPGTTDWSSRYGIPMKVNRPSELADLLETAGFSDVSYDVGPDGKMLAVCGRK